MAKSPWYLMDKREHVGTSRTLESHSKLLLIPVFHPFYQAGRQTVVYFPVLLQPCWCVRGGREVGVPATAVPEVLWVLQWVQHQYGARGLLLLRHAEVSEMSLQQGVDKPPTWPDHQRPSRQPGGEGLVLDFTEFPVPNLFDCGRLCLMSVAFSPLPLFTKCFFYRLMLCMPKYVFGNWGVNGLN